MKFCTNIGAFFAKLLVLVGLYDHINQIPKLGDEG